MAASALEKNVATFCSVAVGGSPPTYTRRACRVACCEGAASAPAEHRVTPEQLQLAPRASAFRQCWARLIGGPCRQAGRLDLPTACLWVSSGAPVGCGHVSASTVRTQGRWVRARRRAERRARQRGRLEACHAGHHKAGRHARHHAARRRLVEACADASPPRSGACFSCHYCAARPGHPLLNCVQGTSTVQTRHDNVVPDLTSSPAGEGAARGNGLQTESAVLTSTCAPSSPSSCSQAHEV